MKKIITFIIFSAFLVSSSYASDWKVRLTENSYGYMELQMKCTNASLTPNAGDPLSGMTFQIYWPTSYVADIDLICTSNPYFIADAHPTHNDPETTGSDNWREYVIAGAPQPSGCPTTWTTDVWETITSFKVTEASGTGNFAIANDLELGAGLNWQYGTPSATTYHPDVDGSISGYTYPTLIYDYVWTGTTNTQWDGTGNWLTECGGVIAAAPNTGNNCIIPSGLANYPNEVNLAQYGGHQPTCSDLKIVSGASLSLDEKDITTLDLTWTFANLTVDGVITSMPNTRLTVTGSTIINSAEGLIVEADATGVGSFIDNGITYGGSGTAKVQTFLTGSGTPGTFDFHCVGPTVDNTGTGVELSEFNVVPGQTYAYKYNEPTNTWDNYSGLTDPVPTAKGIGLSTNDGSTNIMSMIGELKTGPVSSEAMTIGGVGNGSYLLSNPYPSSVYWDDLLLNNAADVNDKVYVYDGSNYLAYNTGSGGIFDGYLQVGQGFFVEAIGASPFTFANSDRHHSNSAFYKSDFTNRLDVRVSGNESTDGLLVHFYEGAVSGYESNEDVAKKMSYRETATQFWTVLDNGQQMSINAMPLELLGKGMQSVPMSFVCGATGEYMMSLLDAETFETGTEIWLEDKQVGGDWVSINDNPDYVFTATPDDLEDRFVIHFFGPTGVNEIGIENTIDIYSYRQHAFVRNNTNEVIKQVNIYTLAGELLQNNETVDLKLSKFWVSNNMGYYVVRVITDKNVYTNKVFISK